MRAPKAADWFLRLMSGSSLHKNKVFGGGIGNSAVFHSYDV
jgi:hypothetical protein